MNEQLTTITATADPMIAEPIINELPIVLPVETPPKPLIIEYQTPKPKPKPVHHRTDPIINGGPLVRRNELCPCGSGKKFKRCHGRN